jgi:hypothetical protein
MPDDYNDGDFDHLFRAEQPTLTRGDVRQEVQKTLSDINIFVSQAQAGVDNAIREITAAHPDFRENRSRLQATLEELPLLKDAVGAAEANPQLSGTLPALYEILWRASQTGSESNATATSESSKLETGRPSDFNEDVMYAAALASQRVSLSPENRKSIISSLEQRGVLDVEF